jgi:hypothetical protein
LSSLTIGIWLPLLVIFLAKWRIFAVKLRFWPANLRANSVDIMVGIAIVFFMANTESLVIRLIWAAVYAIWLLFIKPRSGIFWVSVQAGIGQLAGLMAIFLLSSRTLDFHFWFIDWAILPISVLVILVGLTCYLAARHFFDSFNEPYAKMLSYLWGYFAAALTWVLGHLLIVYPGSNGPIAQPTIFLSVIGYTLAAIYYLEHFDRLSKTVKRELLYISAGAVAILVVSLFYEGLHLIV